MYRRDLIKVNTLSTLLAYLDGTMPSTSCAGTSCLLGRLIVDAMYNKYRRSCDHVWVCTLVEKRQNTQQLMSLLEWIDKHCIVSILAFAKHHHQKHRQCG
jgi:hypothetical protein